MLPIRILEYLYYIGLFILLFKYTNGALTDLRQHRNHLTTEKSLNITSTTTSEPTPPPTAATVAELSSQRPTTSPSSILSDTKLKQTIADCSHVFSWLCLKIEFIQFLDRLIERDEVPIITGITLVRDLKAKKVKNSQILAGTHFS